MNIMTSSTFFRLGFAGWVFLLACGLSAGVAAQSLSDGIDRCDNGGKTVATSASRYLPASGRLELPLVFVPGTGWYRATLQTAPGADLRFSLVELTASCDKQDAPAAYFPSLATLLVPNVEVSDAAGQVSRFDAQLRYLPESNLFAPTQIWESDSTSSPATFAGLPGKFAAVVTALRLLQAIGPYPAGTTLAMTRVEGGRVSNPDTGCTSPHLHGGPITIDNGGPYSDPDPHGCGFGHLVQVEESSLDPGMINATVPAGTDYCGPDIGTIFFARLKVMAKRLQALPDSERGVFDGTLFLARNGTNMDFVTGGLKDTQSNPLCPTAKCSGIGHTSTFTLCGQCMISHIDNDIEFGFVSKMLGVPWSVQLAGGHAWDLWQRGSLDPLPSQIAYRIGNDLAAAIIATPTASDEQLCTALGNSRLRTGVATWKSAAQLFSQELAAFGKSTCVPCPYGCPEALIQKDFAVQTWQLDGGGTAPYTP